MGETKVPILAAHVVIENGYENGFIDAFLE